MHTRRALAPRLGRLAASCGWLGLWATMACTSSAPPLAPPPADGAAPAEPEKISGPTPERQRQWMIACEPPPRPPPPPPGRGVDEQAQERYSALVYRFREAVGVDACTPEPWLRRQAAYPDIEGLYCVLSVVYDVCEQPEQAVAWAEKRAEHFPEHAQAWLGLAVRRFDALWPIPGTLAPYNEQLPGPRRYAIANAVIEALLRAIELDPSQRDPYVYLAMAYTQRQFARRVPATPRTDRERLDALLDREDAYLANRAARELCKLDAIPECRGAPRPDCCPPPLFSREQVQAYSAEKKRLLARLGPDALEHPTLADDDTAASPRASVRDHARDIDLESLMDHAVYVPDPDAKALALSPTGQGDKHGGVSQVAFCVDTHGQTTDVETVHGFPQDPRIDEICRETVGRWRFRPVEIEGKRAAVCSVMSFDIQFQ